MAAKRQTRAGGAKPAWTDVAAIADRLWRLWDKGALVAHLAGGESVFPLRVPLKGPTASDILHAWWPVCEWSRALVEAGGGEQRSFDVEMRTVRGRSTGENTLPCAVVFQTLEDALRLLARRGGRRGERDVQAEAVAFAAMAAQAEERFPALLPWLRNRAPGVTRWAAIWPRLLDVMDWMRQHPRPRIYLRQMDIAGVHTKLVEEHAGLISQLLALAVPRLLPGEGGQNAVLDADDSQGDSAADADAARTATGIADDGLIRPAGTARQSFCRRWGFLDKPLLVRFRFLDEQLLPLCGGWRELTLRAEDFAALNPAVERVFIVENEINFLAFPDVPGAMLLFGAGYACDGAHLAEASWLAHLPVHYWGDIDTHGFAILNRVRAVLPRAVSFLMDEATLMACRDMWVEERTPARGSLPRLTPEERHVYEGLCADVWQNNLRLEQERIGYGRITAELERLGLLRGRR